MLERLLDRIKEDTERDVPRLDMAIMTIMTTAVIIVPFVQYFIK